MNKYAIRDDAARSVSRTSSRQKFLSSAEYHF